MGDRDGLGCVCGGGGFESVICGTVAVGVDVDVGDVGVDVGVDVGDVDVDGIGGGGADGD